MQISRLTLDAVRNLEPVELAPGPGLNLFVGPNGAGKSSLLEAIHLLAYGRSFRGRVRDGLIRTGSTALEVFAEWSEPQGTQRRVGLRHTGQDWKGRLDGESVSQLNELCAALAVLTFEPGSHSLVTGAAEHRRRYVDWGLFHVEPSFLPIWRRYARALKQRNALLKQRAPAAELDPWDAELAAAAGPLDAGRQAYFDRLQPLFASISDELTPQLGAARLVYRAGWRSDALPLDDALLLARARDLATGFTSVGPHRADWRVEHAGRAGGEALSRGQSKLTALACLLAQAQDFADVRHQWPVVLLDDLASELDESHQQRLLAKLEASGTQVLMTGVAPLSSNKSGAIRTFHVEQGRISAA